MKRLASLEEIESNEFRLVMDEINNVGQKGNLRVFKTYSRLWEYPFCWLIIAKHYPLGAKILDIGSEKSPFPFFLALKGYDVTVTEVKRKYIGLWREACNKLKTSVSIKMTASERLPFPDASFDIYLSVSVIEHTLFKKEAIEEAARVIKPGGLLILTFDICEKDMGMTYPREFGIPWDMSKFDEIFSTLPFFNPLDKNVQWNTEVIQNFLIWHQTTKPIHNYIIGAAVFRRTGREVPPRNRYNSSILKLKILDRYYFRPFVINILQRVWGKIQRI